MHDAHQPDEKKADSFASCLRSSRITIPELLTFLNTMYSPSMFYSLPAVAAEEEVWSDVKRDLVETVLQKMGTRYPSQVEAQLRYHINGL